MAKPLKTTLLALAMLAVTACSRGVQVDPLQRAHVDRLNKEAFVNRYRNPERSIDLSQEAILYVTDSLPAYADGRLRALNNLAFAHYQLSQTDEARRAIALVEKASGSPNADIERAIGMLLQARLLQRDCRIADSYRLLYAVGESEVLRHNRDNLLYNFAQTEYYIALLTLNFHYRNGKEADVRSLIDEVERRRADLKVDYAQEMALNYAIAYGYQTAGESLMALEYCDRNYALLELDSAYCPFHMANTLQMEAYALRSLPGASQPDSVLALYAEAYDRFWDYGDPYQVMGGATSSARYALLIGDTLTAREILTEWLDSKTEWRPFSAPKMELSLFDLLIRSHTSQRPDDLRRWYVHHAELQAYIDRNEREDFVLQTSLADAQERSRQLGWFLLTLGSMALVLVVLVVALWVTTRRLRREKERLEEANRRDVERIANVETCLSVLRHDVAPFVGYLRRSDLPESLRAEVLEQLLRTFDNISHWTRLSAPRGLSFHSGEVALQTVFDEVASQHVPPHEGVTLRFTPTPLRVQGDQLLLIIMLRNLVNNALQHTDTGSVAVSAQAADNDMVDIAVADTGSGMTDEQVEHLFKADRPGADGHGFGLLLCRYIIHRHDDQTRRGCRLWAESAPGQGTTMHCLIASA